MRPSKVYVVVWHDNPDESAIHSVWAEPMIQPGKSMVEGFVYTPYIPLQVTPTMMEDFFPPREPSAVDRLAALADPDGESAKRVERWKRWRTTLLGKPNPGYFDQVSAVSL